MNRADDEGTLDPDECEHLVRDACVGRVAWLSRRGLQVLPVTYTVIDGVIMFCTSVGSTLFELMPPHDVAVQIGDGEEPARVSYEATELARETSSVEGNEEHAASGWSVLVQGEARITDTLPSDLPIPSTPGGRNVVVAIMPRAYSGRAVTTR